MDEVLLQHDFLENLREGVAARISAVLLFFRDWKRVGIEEMAQGSVAANEDDLLKRGTGAAGLQQPEQALHGHIDDIVWRFLAGRAMEHMSNTGYGLVHDSTIRNASLHNLHPRARMQNAIVTQSADAYAGVLVGAENSINEVAAYFARGACDQDESSRIGN